MTNSLTTALDISLRVVPQVDDEHGHCVHCQGVDAVVQANAYVPAGGEVVFLEACLACILPAIDAVPYLDTDTPIILEVSRDATARPF